jgi:peptide/nickel transport system substrate-binding protein
MPKDRDHPRPARQIVKSLGYSADKKLKIKVSTRDLPFYPDPAVILIDQLKEIYIDGELDPVDTTGYFPKIMRKDFTVGLNIQTSGPDPDQVFGSFYGCGSNLNWD